MCISFLTKALARSEVMSDDMRTRGSRSSRTPGRVQEGEGGGGGGESRVDGKSLCTLELLYVRDSGC